MKIKCDKCSKEHILADKTKIISIICSNCKNKVYIKKPIMKKKGEDHGSSKKSKNTGRRSKYK